jgi:hypothetical protein
MIYDRIAFGDVPYLSSPKFSDPIYSTVGSYIQVIPVETPRPQGWAGKAGGIEYSKHTLYNDDMTILNLIVLTISDGIIA